MSNYRVLVASPVRQCPDILTHFVDGLRALEDEAKVGIDYFFIDDNITYESREIISNFVPRGNIKIFRPEVDGQQYDTDGDTHKWTQSLMSKVAGFKDFIINFAVEERYDYLFLVDSDLVIHPRTVDHLIALGHDVVSEVFWTKWTPSQTYAPQVWVSGQYDFYKPSAEIHQDSAELKRQTASFFSKLYNPGCYKVGGLGACTLLSRSALIRGVRFEEISNLNYVGEDRHFCVRAAALGIELWADTTFPPIHLYRQSEVVEEIKYKKLLFSERWMSGDIKIILDCRDLDFENVVASLTKKSAMLMSLGVSALLLNSREKIVYMNLDNGALESVDFHHGGGVSGSTYKKFLTEKEFNWVLNIKPSVLDPRVLGFLRSQLIENKDMRAVNFRPSTTGGNLPFARAFRFTPFFDYKVDPHSLFPSNLGTFITCTITVEGLA